MREWTDSIQEFPQDNAANYVNGRFDPHAAEALRASYLQQAQLRAKLAAEARTIAQLHKPARKSAR
jgi:hypothetical protein